MKRLVQHLWVIPGIVLLLAGLNFAADPYLMKSGDTTPEIDVEMWKSADGTTCAVIIDPNDVTVYYTEEGEAQESYSDAVECTSEAAAWVAKSCISRPSKNSMRICLPTDAVDGGIGKYVKIWVTTGTYEGSATIHLGAPVNAYLSDGSTPPTLADLEDADYSDATFPDMTLADDAITSAKFDESTAFPLKSADTGDTTVARKGSGTQTLTTLATELDKVPKSDGTTSWNSTALAAIANAVMSNTIENGLTLRQIVRILSAVLVGKSNYSEGKITFTGLDGVTERATVTISGNSRTDVSGLNGD